MSGHTEAASRDQATLFPGRLDELIAPDAMVRVVEAFVGTLDLAVLGFAKAKPARTGRPSYAPHRLKVRLPCTVGEMLAILHDQPRPLPAAGQRLSAE